MNVARCLLALAIASVGCGSTDHNRPMDWHIVLGGDSIDSAVAPVFDAWARAAIHLPLSTFAVWLAGAQRDSCRLVTALTVPDSWGAGVMEAKAAFLRDARVELLRAVQHPTMGNPELTLSPRRSGSAAPRLVLLEGVGVPPQIARSLESACDAPPNEGHTAVLCDFSTSMRASPIADLLTAYDTWLAQADHATGSTFNAYRIGASYDTAELVFSIQMPSTELGRRAAYLVAGRNELRSIGLPTDGSKSAIAEAIAAAGTALQGRAGRRYLMILSDMRQYTAGAYNFESSVPDPAVFLSWLKRESLLPDLRGVSVVVAGLDNHGPTQSRPFTAEKAARLRGAWTEAFTAMGVQELTMFAGSLSATAAAR